MLQTINSLSSTLFGDPRFFVLEHRLFNTITLLSAVANIGGAFTVMSQQSYQLLFLLNLGTGLLFLVFYFLSRFHDAYGLLLLALHPSDNRLLVSEFITECRLAWRRTLLLHLSISLGHNSFPQDATNYAWNAVVCFGHDHFARRRELYAPTPDCRTGRVFQPIVAELLAARSSLMTFGATQ